MLKHFKKVDIAINANPTTNILAERWGIRVYAISLLLKVTPLENERLLYFNEYDKNLKYSTPRAISVLSA